MKGVDRIGEVHAWLVTDVDGTEGIPAVQTPYGMLPLMTGVTPSGKALMVFSELARQAAKSLLPGQTMRHVVFGQRTDLEDV